MAVQRDPRHRPNGRPRKDGRDLVLDQATGMAEYRDRETGERVGLPFPMQAAVEVQAKNFHKPLVAFQPRLAENILERIACGFSEEWLEEQDWYPGKRSVYAWRRRNPDFARAWRVALEEQSEVLEAQCLSIADAPLLPGQGMEEIGKRKLQIETRMKIAALNNKKKHAAPLPVAAVSEVPTVERKSLGEAAHRKLDELEERMRNAKLIQGPSPAGVQ
jgi:hypothetical protein